MSQEAMIEANKRMGEAITSGKLEELREVISEAVVDHDPAPDQGPGAQGFIDFFTTMRNAFPDLYSTVEHQIATDDHVAVAYRMRGTHGGDFMGIPATGKPVDIRGMQIARFEDGKMVERWGSSDQLSMFQQLGAEPRLTAD